MSFLYKLDSIEEIRSNRNVATIQKDLKSVFKPYIEENTKNADFTSEKILKSNRKIRKSVETSGTKLEYLDKIPAFPLQDYLGIFFYIGLKLFIKTGLEGKELRSRIFNDFSYDIDQNLALNELIYRYTWNYWLSKQSFMNALILMSLLNEIDSPHYPIVLDSIEDMVQNKSMVSGAKAVISRTIN